MKISGVSLDQFRAVVAEVSSASYSTVDLCAGNITVCPDGHERYDMRKPGCVARLTVTDSHGPGSRVTWTGRHGPYACWHAYRDVLSKLFELYPDAIVRTGMAVYRHRDGFEAAYPATADRNIGSVMQPVTMPELCACDGSMATTVSYESLAAWERELPTSTLWAASHRASYEQTLTDIDRALYDYEPLDDDGSGSIDASYLDPEDFEGTGSDDKTPATWHPHHP